MTDRSALHLCLVPAGLATWIALGGCSRQEVAIPQVASATQVVVPTRSATPESFAYAAPVSGRYSESSLGELELVDGIAFPSSAGAGTVVYVTSASLASPVLSESACPMSSARALALLRDAPYLEITLDAAGGSKYLASGVQLGGRGREEDAGGRHWQIDPQPTAAGRVGGTFTYEGRGSFTFDLPIAEPTVVEVSESDRIGGRRVPEGATAPDEAEVVEAYRALHAAAKARDLAAMLVAQGFSEREIAAIRGFAGIDADFAAFADLFLDPGLPGEPSVYAGYGGIASTGTNAKGEKYRSYYEFAPCGARLLLVGISADRL